MITCVGGACDNKALSVRVRFFLGHIAYARQLLIEAIFSLIPVTEKAPILKMK